MIEVIKRAWRRFRRKGEQPKEFIVSMTDPEDGFSVQVKMSKAVGLCLVGRRKGKKGSMDIRVWPVEYAEDRKQFIHAWLELGGKYMVFKTDDGTRIDPVDFF